MLARHGRPGRVLLSHHRLQVRAAGSARPRGPLASRWQGSLSPTAAAARSGGTTRPLRSGPGEPVVKRSALKRRRGLQRSRKRISSTSAKRRAWLKAWAKVRADVLTRDFMRCRWCGAWATDVHHVVKRSQTSNTLDPNLLVALCRSCHDWTDGVGSRGKLVVMALGGERFRFYIETADKFTARNA